jgi:zinc D-Ala-D-Ala dipeptidase
MFYKLTYLFITLSIAPSLIQNGENPFVRLEDLSDNFYYDMRYATENNFLKKKLYQCDDCVIRTEVASALIKANDYFNKKGYSIKFYDCYRPLDIQKLMWEVFPNAQYVANPEYGSIHNRGGAVDITLVNKDNVEIDMGTEFDHFGEEAHHSYTKLSKEILANRALLKEGMEMHGFTAIRTEWWHYNFGEAKKYAVSNFQVECNE